MLSTIVALFRSQPTAKIEALARQIVDLSVEEISRLVAHQTDRMSLAEARGYVRARSSVLVRCKSWQIIARHPDASPLWNDAIVRRATELVVPLVLRRVGTGLPQSLPNRLAA